jgi:phage gp16-like protein
MQRPDPKKRLVQLIHIAKSSLQMDDAIYRANLQTWTGKNSTTAMSVRQLEKVMAGFKTLGFTPVAAARKRPAKKPLPQGELSKLGQIWTQMAAQGFVRSGSYHALEQWAVPQSKHLNNGTAIERLEWMDSIAFGLIEQLKNWHRRLMLKALGTPHSRSSYQDTLDYNCTVIAAGGEHGN